jgi:ATP-dependent DNA helicase RecG
MRYRETEKLELKRSTSELKEAIISIVSILNKHSIGEIIFGINSNGKIIGQDVNEKTIRLISQKIANSIEPRIYPEIYKENIEDKECIIIKFTGDESIYYADGKAYIRIGDEDRKLSAKEIEKRIVSKSNIKWDGNVSEKEIDDINEDLLKEYINQAKKVGRINFFF